MKDIPFKTRSSEWIGDMPAWLIETLETNDEQLERVRRNLRKAREQELTRRQRQILAMYYDKGMTMGQIALQLHINRSTVSRTLRRARELLYRYLQYSF